MTAFEIVPLQEATTSPCACCNHVTHNLRGEARVNGQLRAVYYVRWTAQRLDGHAEWLLDIADGREVPITERSIVALRCRSHKHWPAFMVVDATRTSWGTQVAKRGRALMAVDVVDQAIGSVAYAIVDQVLAQDPRVKAQFQAMAAAEPSRWRRWLSDRWPRGRHSRHRATADAAVT